MMQIPIDDLPKTFRDAVRITRELGERFLWIDSLCIIQDYEEDWAREAAMMAEIYSHSYCTLAALSSNDSTEGCRLIPNIQDSIGQFLEFDSEDRRFGPYRIRIFQDEPREWHEEYGDDPYRRVGYGNSHNPLRSRAWTLQERELSRRSVHFGKDQLLWECLERKASAQLPWYHKTPETDFEKWPIRNTLTESLAPDGPVAMRDGWYELMEDYSFRSLTKETDKLPALSGLAQYYQDVFRGGQYLAGIWSTHLPAALLWRSMAGPDNRSPSYIAPTWSWASVKGQISYESQRLDDSGGSSEERPQEQPSACDFGDLKVEQMLTIPKYDDTYGAIRSASLVLSGVLLAAIDPRPQVKEILHSYRDVRSTILTKNGATVGLLYTDADDEIEYAGNLFCLSVRGESDPSQIAQPRGLYKRAEVDASELVMGLVVEDDLEAAGEYRRIGLARWVKRSLFEGCRPSLIRLV